MRQFQRWRLRYFRRFRTLGGCTVLLVTACVTVYRISGQWSPVSRLTASSSQRGSSPLAASPPLPLAGLPRDRDVFASHFMGKFRFQYNYVIDSKNNDDIKYKKIDLDTNKGSGRYPRLPDEWPQFFFPRSQTQFSLDTFPYRLRPADDLCKAPVDLAVLVLSTPGHWRRRQALRDTWGSVVRDGWQGGGGGGDEGGWGDASDVMWAGEAGRVRLVFLLGQPAQGEVADDGEGGREGDRSSDDALKKESEEHGDLLQWEGLADTYYNLTMKVLLGLRWVTQHCWDVRFVMKVDDDTFVHVPRLLRRVHSLAWTDSICGAFYKSSPCDRSGRYAVSREAYPFDLYPPHVKGNMYLLPGHVVQRLVLFAPYLPYNNMEDVHVTGTLARALGLRHEPFLQREFSVAPRSPDPCVFMDDVTLGSQRVSAALAYKIWATFSDSTLCSSIAK